MSPLDRQLTALILNAFPLSAPPPAPPARAVADWDALVERARYQGLAPLLYAALETEKFAGVPPGTVETLREQYRSSALAAAAAYRELDAILAQFQARAIPVVVLKGAALAPWLYPSRALRPFGDLDLLVCPPSASAAQALLQARGYFPTGELAPGFAADLYSERAFTRRAPPRTSIDLHWDLFVPLYYRRRLDREWFWRHTQPWDLENGSPRREREGAAVPTLAGAPALRLDPTAQFVHLAVHAGLNHQHAPRLLWLYDLALLLHGHGDEIAWDDVVRYASSAALGRSMVAVLDQVQIAWQVSPAPEYRAALNAARLGAVERLAFALTAAPHSEARALADALSAPGIRNKFRYALRHLFPDAEYMRRRYHVRRNALLPAYYLRRLGEITIKFSRSLWSAFAG